MMQRQSTLLPLVLLAVLSSSPWLITAQNFDCADQKQVLSFCALTNDTATSLNDCISCVYPEFPADPTFDCPVYSDQVCGLVQANCSDACPLLCINEFNAWVTCAADHPRRCNVTCDFATEDGTAESGAGSLFQASMSVHVLVGLVCVVAYPSLWM